MGPCSVFLSLPTWDTCCELVANHISHFEVFMMRACVIFLAFVAVALAEVFLDERFADGDAWEKRWIQSTNKGEAAGKFVLTHGKFYGDAEKDLGIQTSQDARFYGLSTKFQPLSSTDSPLVIQFTVKHEQNIDCGGGYVKLFDCNLAQEDMHGDSPYLIMFGPDICGPSSKKLNLETWKPTGTSSLPRPSRILKPRNLKIGMTEPRLMILKMSSLKTGKSPNTLLILRPRNQKIGTMKWMVNGNPP